MSNVNVPGSHAPRLDSGQDPRRRSPKRALGVGAGLFLLLALAGCRQAAPPAQAPVITIEASGSAAEGSPLQFLVRADPAPAADLTVGVSVSGCELKQAPDSVTIAAGESGATLTVPTSGAGAGTDGCTVTATLAAGEGYRVGDTAESAGATVTPATALPEVSIAATAASVTEGSPVSFTLTAAPRPASDLVIDVTWSESGSFLAARRPQTVTIPVSGTATLSAATVDDSVAEPNGMVTVTVERGSGYTVGSSGSATVAVTDDDTATTGPTGPTSPGPGTGSPPPRPPSGSPLVNIRNINVGSVTEGDDARFQIVAFPKPASSVTVSLTWNDPTGRLSSPPSTVTIPKAIPEDQNAFHVFSVATVENAVADGDVRVWVTVNPGSGYEPNPDTDFSSTSFGIADDEVTMAVEAGSATEGSAVTFKAKLSRALGANVTLGWTTGNDDTTGADQATSGTDYTAVTSGSVTITAGETEASFSVSTTEDTDDEEDETFKVTVTGKALADGVTIVGPASAVGTIEDDD